MGFSNFFTGLFKKNEKQEESQPLESPLEDYVQSIVLAFEFYDGWSNFSLYQLEKKIRPIGERLNDNEKQLLVFNRVCVLVKQLKLGNVNKTWFKRCWKGCGGW